jgi:alkylhydroperoxidase family enzyme
VAFIETIPDDEATGPVAEMYDLERRSRGYVPNYARAFSHRPATYGGWRALNLAIREGMDRRRYELATVAAARRLRSSYCTLAHGTLLADAFLPPDRVRDLVVDHRSSASPTARSSTSLPRPRLAASSPSCSTPSGPSRTRPTPLSTRRSASR